MNWKSSGIFTNHQRINMNEWISTKDRMPENSDTVLLYCEVSVGISYKFGFYDDLNDEFAIFGKYKPTPTHWTTLPEPPQH